MTITNKTILITGANRGIGRSLVEEALKRGAKQVYAGTRQPWTHPDGRVTRLAMDVTNGMQIRDAVGQVEFLDILINNAGAYSLHGDDFRDRSLLERHIATNLFGPYDVTQAFLPLLIRSRGAIVNVLSLASLAGLPLTPACRLPRPTRSRKQPRSLSRNRSAPSLRDEESGFMPSFPDPSILT